MTDTANHLQGPWVAILSAEGNLIPDASELSENEAADICIVRRSAVPVENEDGALDWPRAFSGDDMIELFEELEYAEAQIRWAQAQAMAAGLNAAGGTA